MSEIFEIGVRHQTAGDQYDSWLDELKDNEDKREQSHPLDSEEARKTHGKILSWFYHERAKQAENRLQMATDSDFYDNEQWSAEDAAEVSSRGQVPLNFNEVAPMVDWIIGTERRSRVDWSVLPRAEDDVQAADAKTKVLKYVSDINRVPFARSRAFADAVKVGVGWVDDGARDDPTEDILYSRYEDWRNVLWDSSSYELDLTDARYVFRWRWVDADIAEAMFPERASEIRRSVVDTGASNSSTLDADWYLGEQITQSGTLYASSDGVYGDVNRRRIRLIECQFRMPVTVKIVTDGPHKGAFLSPHDTALMQVVNDHGSTVVDKIAMRMHVAVFTERDLLSMGPSIYRHNRYSLTPIWCYRRGRDRLPYGAIRRVRDIQQDLNKRASKALFLLSTNQIIAEEDAVADKEVARFEADQPDGYIEVRKGKRFDIQHGTDAAAGQIQMMTLDAQSIQRTAGVNNENLGRSTNAVSGEAIKARQLQGAVGTTEIFDNLRFAVQVQGEKQLSQIEQFYPEEKAVRLTGAKGKIEWLRINQPEVQADGSVRYINDITASASDFVVSEADYAGTLRQVMFDGISQMAQRMTPDAALRLFVVAMEFSDLPNKDEIAGELRRITGERDPDKPMTPEEAAQAEQQMQAQAEALAMQRETAMNAVNEGKARVEKLLAEADEIRSRAGNGGGMPAEHEQKLMQALSQADAKLEAMSEELRKVQSDASKQIMALRQDADTKHEVARIDADAKVRVAEINSVSKMGLDEIAARIDAIASAVGQNTPAALGEDNGAEPPHK